MKFSQRTQRVLKYLTGRSGRTVPITFGSFAPDMPSLRNPGCLMAKNVIPRHASFAPLPDLSSQAGALNAYARGAIAAKDSNGNTYFYAGDATKLYEIRNATVTDKSSAAYALAADSYWEATQFQDRLIFTDYDDAVQSITVGAAGNFANLITSAKIPKARHCATVLNFLVLGNINDSAEGVKPGRVHWSAENDPTDFDLSSATGCDLQDLDDGGWVQRIIGGAEYGVIFQERVIRRMTPTTSDLIFEIVPVDRQRGTPIPRSVIAQGRILPYISEEGFMVFDGVQSVPIGDGFVDRWFWDQFDPTYRHRVSAAIDFKNKLWVWGFPGTDSVSGAPNRILMCHYPSKRWAYGEVNHEMMVSAETQAYSLDTMDSVMPTIEVASPSLDSEVWMGGFYRFGAFNTDHKLCFFTGDNLAAQIDSAEFELSPGNRSFIRSVRPMVEGTSVSPTIALGSRLTQQQAETYSSDVAIETEGDCPMGEQTQANDRYQRVRLKIPAASTWTHTNGVLIEQTKSSHV